MNLIAHRNIKEQALNNANLRVARQLDTVLKEQQVLRDLIDARSMANKEYEDACIQLGKAVFGVYHFPKENK